MSGSFKKAAKSFQKVHRERAQPAKRAHLGPLERKTNYVERASDHNNKRDKLKALQRKAADRNPDEFYFGMVSSEKVDGVHQAKKSETRDKEQDILLRSKDIRYITIKLNMEKKKVEKLKKELHFLGPEFRKNHHTIFVDDEKDAAKAKKMKKERMKEDQRIFSVSPEQRKELNKSYGLLVKREQRVKELQIVLDKLVVDQNVDKDKTTKKKLVKEETKNSAAVYRWCFKRKR